MTLASTLSVLWAEEWHDSTAELNS
jgi:hypothetical protein